MVPSEGFQSPQSGAPPFPYKEKLASFVVWLAMRAFTLLWTAAVIYMMTLPAERITPHPTPVVRIAFLAFAVFFNLIVHRYAYGDVRQDGVRYRQWLGRKFLAWRDIREVKWWGPWTGFIEIKKREGGLVDGSIRLMRYRPWRWRDFWKHEVPADVLWMQHQVELAGPEQLPKP